MRYAIVIGLILLVGCAQQTTTPFIDSDNLAIFGRTVDGHLTVKYRLMVTVSWMEGDEELTRTYPMKIGTVYPTKGQTDLFMMLTVSNPNHKDYRLWTRTEDKTVRIETQKYMGRLSYKEFKLPLPKKGGWSFQIENSEGLPWLMSVPVRVVGEQ